MEKEADGKTSSNVLLRLLCGLGILLTWAYVALFGGIRIYAWANSDGKETLSLSHSMLIAALILPVVYITGRIVGAITGYVLMRSFKN